MSRLPKVGSDDQIWGDLLNDFLGVEHNPNGTLKARSDGSLYSKPAEGIPKDDLDADVQAALGVGTMAIADATTSARGRVQLSGDLAGTAVDPRVKSRTINKTIGPAGSVADYVCDGNADNVEFDAAIQAIKDAGGGELFVKAGTYSFVTGILVPSNIHITGEDEYAAKILLANSGNATLFSNADHTNGNTNIWFSKLTLNGNGANQTAAGNGIYLEHTTDCLIDRVHVADTRDKGINLAGASAVNPTSQRNIIQHCTVTGTVNPQADGIYLFGGKNNTVTSCRSHHNAQDGLFLDASANTSVLQGEFNNNGRFGAIVWSTSDSRIEQCDVYSNVSVGILLDNGSHRNYIVQNNVHDNGQYGIRGGTSALSGGGTSIQNTYNKFLYNHVERNADDALIIEFSDYATVIGNVVRLNGTHSGDQGMPIDSSSYCTISNNVVELNQSDGIELKNGSNYCMLNGNVSKNNSNPDLGGSTNASGIIIQEGIVGCTLTGNSVYCDRTDIAPSQLYGINLTGVGVDHNTIVGNFVYNNRTSQIRLQSAVGVHNQIHSNTGSDNSQINNLPLVVNNAEIAKNGVTINQTAAPNANFAPLVVNGTSVNSTPNAYGLLAVRQTNAASTNRGAWFDHAGTGEVATFRAAQGRGVVVDNNGPSLAIYSDHDVTNENWSLGSLQMDNRLTVNDGGTYTRSGSLFSVSADITATSGTIIDTAVVANVDQNNTGATGAALRVTNAGTGSTVSIDPNGSTGTDPSVAAGLYIENTGNAGYGMSIYTNRGATQLAPLATLRANNTAFSKRVVDIVQNGVEDGMLINHTGSSGRALYITHTDTGASPSADIVRTGNNAAPVVGLQVAATNAGAGGAYAALFRSGRVGIGTATPTGTLDVNANLIRVRTAKTPANATDTGNQGEIAWDANYIYVCVATNTWKRVAISSW